MKANRSFPIDGLKLAQKLKKASRVAVATDSAGAEWIADGFVAVKLSEMPGAGEALKALQTSDLTLELGRILDREHYTAMAEATEWVQQADGETLRLFLVTDSPTSAPRPVMVREAVWQGTIKPNDLAVVFVAQPGDTCPIGALRGSELVAVAMPMLPRPGNGPARLYSRLAACNLPPVTDDAESPT